MMDKPKGYLRYNLKLTTYSIRILIRVTTATCKGKHENVLISGSSMKNYRCSLSLKPMWYTGFHGRRRSYDLFCWHIGQRLTKFNALLTFIRNTFTQLEVFTVCVYVCECICVCIYKKKSRFILRLQRLNTN